MSGILDNLYARSPIAIQNLGISVFGWFWKLRRQSGVFRTELDRFESRDLFTGVQWTQYQTKLLRELLQWSYAHVPAYRRRWAALGLYSEDLKAFQLSDLQRLPLLEREELRQSPTDFVAKVSPRRKLHVLHTSGSTGTPVAIYLSSQTHQKIQAAYEARCRRWAGVNYKMSRAMIGGRLVVPKAFSRPPFWRHNWAEKQLYMSAFHIAPENAAAYAAALGRFRPDYLVGYASAHFFLARMIEEGALSVPSPKAVLTSSEKLTSEMRETLERVYRAPVFDAYSGVEGCCLASECSHHRLHLSPDVGVVEILDEVGCPVPAGQTGEVVATGLLNFDQPLVRYRTGDLAALSTESCPCGRAMPVIGELVGRLEDTVLGLDGRETVRFHGIFIGLPSVREGQVIQEALDHIRVRVVAPQGLSDKEGREISHRVQHRLGPVRVDVEVVPRIERTERGKFKAVISHVPRRAGVLHPSSPVRNS